MVAMMLAKQSPPNTAIWQTVVVILAAVALLAALLYAANRSRQR
jgi:hypothetical protein